MKVFPRSISQVGKNDFHVDVHLDQTENADFSRNFETRNFVETVKKYEFKGKINCFPDPEIDQYRNSHLGMYLNLVKQRNQENQNTDKTSEIYQQYLERLKTLLSNAKGAVLDIGADNFLDMLNLLPLNTIYIPFGPEESNFEGIEQGDYVQGIGEMLPFLDQSFHTVMFNTSLDHILDSNSAINEAYRVLHKNGIVIICTLIWLDQVELWRDDVHFHHFTPGEMEALLEKFEIIYLRTYEYKGNSHRYGAYIAARKVE